MDYTIDGRDYTVKADGDAVVIDGAAHRIEVLSMSHTDMEFLLDDQYHRVTYLENAAGKLAVEVDGVPVTLMTRRKLDEIVYKNSGGAGEALAESALLSQIPGKVVSVAVSPGDAVSQGDTVCVLESMKMQVSVKAHLAGTIKSVRPKVGSSVAKGDMIAEIE